MRVDATINALFTGPDEKADVSVIIVNYNTAHLLERCISSLRAASRGCRVQLLVVDNASRDDSARKVRSSFADALLVVNHTNVGFGRANNQVLPLLRGRHLLLLNADAYLLPDTLMQGLRYLDNQPRCGVLGVRSTDEAGGLLFADRTFPTVWSSFTLQTGLFHRPSQPVRQTIQSQGSEAVDADWVVGCCYFVRGELVRSMGLFDPRFFLYMEEVDHCRRVREAGWQVQCLLSASVVHEGGGAAASDGELSAARQISEFQTESSLLYYRKHGGLIGVLGAVLLSLATEAVVGLKQLLKPRRWRHLGTRWRNIWQLLGLVLRTRLGRVPTR